MLAAGEARVQVSVSFVGNLRLLCFRSLGAKAVSAREVPDWSSAAEGAMYTIQSDPDRFLTGWLPDGDQIHFGILLPDLVSLTFSPEGELKSLHTERIADQFLLRYDSSLGIDPTVARELMQSHQVAIQVANTPIEVKPFFLPDLSIGVCEEPSYFADVLSNTDLYDQDLISIVLEDMKRLRFSRAFVFWWCEEYFLDANGVLTDS